MNLVRCSIFKVKQSKRRETGEDDETSHQRYLQINIIWKEITMSIQPKPHASTMTDSTTIANRQTLYHHYRVAVSVNNIGVTLFEMQCYEQAAKTFTEAIKIMEQVIRAGDNDIMSSDPTTMTVGGVNHDPRLIHAKSRLVRCFETTPAEINAPPDDNHAHRHSRIDRERGEQEQERVQNDAESDVLESQIFRTPIRIIYTTMLSARGDNVKNFELESAILLYNLATIHHIVSRDASFQSSKEKALTLFKLAYGILSRKMFEEEEDIWVEFDEMMGLLFLTVVNNIMQILYETERRDEARRYLELLSRISAQVPSDDEDSIDEVNLTAAPAA